MRKKINRTGFAIAGAAALLAGHAVNVTAIPVSMRYHYTPTVSMDSLTASVSPEPFLAQNVDPPATLGSFDFNHDIQDAWGSDSSSIDQRHHPRHFRPVTGSNVPDSGSTGIMLGGVLCGLVFLKKNGSLSRFLKSES
jgi:hypothetical protein